MKISLHKALYKLGKLFMALYIIFSFISTVNFIPSITNSICLYTFAALGLFALLLNPVVSNAYIKWYFLLIIFSFISVFYSGGDDWWSTLYQMIVMLILANSFVQFIKSIYDFKLICWSYSIGSVVLFVLLLRSNQLFMDERLGTTVMGNANTFALTFMVATILAIGMALYSEKIIIRVVFVVAIIVNFYAIMLSGGRKFLLVPIIVLYFMLLQKTDRSGRKHFLIYTILVIAMLVALNILIHSNETLYKAVGYRMDYLINMLLNNGGEIGASNELRKELRLLAFTQGFNSPIFGHGFDSFKYLAREQLNFYAYAHNNWAEIWYDLGIIGILFFYSFYLKIYNRLKRIRLKNEFIANLGMAIIVGTIIYEYGGVTYYAYPNQIMLCILTCVCEIIEKEKQKDEQDAYRVKFVEE